MKRVLFADDEPLVLEGLRNVLRKQRTLWDMSFVGSGRETLAALVLQPQDAVVCDMHMPGMDGAELLRQVRDRYPGTARVMLTGQASQEDLFRALPVAQQILVKPCDPSTLRETLERLFKVQALLGNERIQALVGGLDRLPSFPECYQRLSEAMLRENVSVAEVAQIVERDPALASTALSMANSAYFGLSKPTASLLAAARHLGFQTLRSLALSSSIFSRIDAALLSSRTLRNMPNSSLSKAHLAQQLVSDPTLADEAFTAGLLLDIGCIVLAQCSGNSYLTLLEIAESSGRALQEVEQESLGVTHAEVGAYLLGVWGLPARLVDLVACHHEPELLGSTDLPLGVALHVADVLVDALRAAKPDPLAGLAQSIRIRADVSVHLAEWQALAEKAVALQ